MMKTKAQRQALYACPFANDQAIPAGSLVFLVVFMELSSFHAKAQADRTSVCLGFGLDAGVRRPAGCLHITKMSALRLPEPQEKQAISLTGMVCIACSCWPGLAPAGD